MARAGRKLRPAWALRAVLFAASFVSFETTAIAAVRLCQPVVSSGLVSAPTELEAKKRALDAWKAMALQHGEAYASWRLATDKLLECLPRKAGGFECLATGAPCTIEQAPDRRELREKRLDM
ncbi:hypothetical protein [Hyphomicrobium sp. LHD-15]|uniref:hypothetical protein n=1 Tax=Hyphomicrobium sp. LHD-15 TaxID=3072142 RepID=UPI00280D73A1|nr:hypothetical protein [Hyphomicrobium sp. LHD-15]MDQ8697889.1 hypothetical protein [Hyphomicrobium sp. LHD-15]